MFAIRRCCWADGAADVPPVLHLPLRCPGARRLIGPPGVARRTSGIRMNARCRSEQFLSTPDDLGAFRLSPTRIRDCGATGITENFTDRGRQGIRFAPMARIPQGGLLKDPATPQGLSKVFAGGLQPLIVIPAKAGIQRRFCPRNSRFRGNDGLTLERPWRRPCDHCQKRAFRLTSSQWSFGGRANELDQDDRCDHANGWCDHRDNAPD